MTDMQITTEALPLSRGAVYNARQLKAALGIGHRTYCKLLDAGLPHTTFNGRHFLDGNDVADFLRNLRDRSTTVTATASQN